MHVIPFRRLISAYREVLIFGLIGVVNTLLHSATVILLVEGLITTPVPANIAGFAVANTASFFANSFFTFRRRPTWGIYSKFFMVSMGSLILTICLSFLAETMGWHYLVGLILVILCGPVLTFLLHRIFTFRHLPPAS